tara:strand:+ start:69 stop:194 length:126 start_codon:yes stop_codon:yes gene_type:complete
MRIAFFLLNMMPETPIKKETAGTIIKIRRFIIEKIVLVFRL